MTGKGVFRLFAKPSIFAAKQNILQLFLLYGIKDPMFMPRYSETSILQDLEEKMVFLSGPRQVGKTTLAELIVIEFVILLGYIRSGGRNRCRSLELYLMEMR
jgi:hypothetical protein